MYLKVNAVSEGHFHVLTPVTAAICLERAELRDQLLVESMFKQLKRNNQETEVGSAQTLDFSLAPSQDDVWRQLT